MGRLSVSLKKSTEPLEFNGLDGHTGRPLLRLSEEELIRLARGEKIEPRYFKELSHWAELISNQPFDVIHGVDLRRLDQSGWGVIWPHDVDPAIRAALAPLLALRRQQAGELFRELTLRPGEATLDFMARHGVGPAPVDPRKLPFYLLIVGSPEQIPFALQYRLDVQYGVGRIAFDQVEAYAAYARGVVAAERGEIRRPRRVSLIAPANPSDRATARSSADLVEPLGTKAKSSHPGWKIDPVLRDAATKKAFAQHLGGEATPALAFVACHGLGFYRGSAEQAKWQGALVCQDWGGPHVQRPIYTGEFFAAEDVADSADVAGLVAFLFACYGAGTPKNEDFYNDAAQRIQLADQAFVAPLPQRLLGHPSGSALAVVGHVERAWTYSFDWPQAGPQLQVFESALGRLLDGYPIGAAMDHFGQRYAELALDVKAGLDDLDYESEPDVLSIAGRVLAFKDARAYVVLGDPAVRLSVASPTG